MGLFDHTGINHINVPIDEIPGILLNVSKDVILSLESLDLFKLGKKDGLQTDTHTNDARQKATDEKKKEWNRQ